MSIKYHSSKRNKLSKQDLFGKYLDKFKVSFMYDASMQFGNMYINDLDIYLEQYCLLTV